MGTPWTDYVAIALAGLALPVAAWAAYSAHGSKKEAKRSASASEKSAKASERSADAAEKAVGIAEQSHQFQLTQARQDEIDKKIESFQPRTNSSWPALRRILQAVEAQTEEEEKYIVKQFFAFTGRAEVNFEEPNKDLAPLGFKFLDFGKFRLGR